VGSLPGPLVAGLPPPYRHGDAGLQLSRVAGTAPATAGASMRTSAGAIFPPGPIGGGRHSLPSTETSSDGSATKRYVGG